MWSWKFSPFCAVLMKFIWPLFVTTRVYIRFYAIEANRAPPSKLRFLVTEFGTTLSGTQTSGSKRNKEPLLFFNRIFPLSGPILLNFIKWSTQFGNKFHWSIWMVLRYHVKLPNVIKLNLLNTILHITFKYFRK